MIKSKEGTVIIEGQLFELFADLLAIFKALTSDPDLYMDKDTILMLASSTDDDLEDVAMKVATRVFAESLARERNNSFGGSMDIEDDLNPEAFELIFGERRH